MTSQRSTSARQACLIEEVVEKRVRALGLYKVGANKTAVEDAKCKGGIEPADLFSDRSDSEEI